MIVRGLPCATYVITNSRQVGKWLDRGYVVVAYRWCAVHQANRKLGPSVLLKKAAGK